MGLSHPLFLFLFTLLLFVIQLFEALDFELPTGFVEWAININNKDDVFIRAEIRTRCRVGLGYYQRGWYELHVYNFAVVPAFIQDVPGGI
jgi:hypothetical protein